MAKFPNFHFDAVVALGFRDVMDELSVKNDTPVQIRIGLLSVTINVTGSG